MTISETGGARERRTTNCIPGEMRDTTVSRTLAKAERT